MSATLILGGARSGKSRFAEELARRSGGGVLFVATAEAGDEEMRQRIAAHRAARPADWKTLEATSGLGESIKEHLGRAKTVVIDCVTLLVSNIMLQHESAGDTEMEKAVDAEIEGLAEAMSRLEAHFIIVSNEVGLGLVPDNAAGRRYRDLLGRANQALARHADDVYLLVAGLPLRLKPPGTPPAASSWPS